MIIVLFEVNLKSGADAIYLDTASYLKPILEKVDGFISVKRFQSLNDPKKLLSMSVWHDETAVKKWRNTNEHRQAQELGRHKLIDKFTIRVVNILREYSLTEREQAPNDSRQFHQ